MPNVSFNRGLLLSMSVLALAACSSDNSAPPSPKTAAPMPPISEMDAAMSAPAPQPLPLSQSDTLTPVMAAAPMDPLAPAAGVNVVETTTTVEKTTVPATSPAPAPGSVEERIAKLESTVNSLRTDYDRIMPAFASLNTTNERIQTLLDEIESQSGASTAQASAAGSTPVLTHTAAAIPAKEKAIPAPGTVSRAKVETPSAKPAVVATTTTVETKPSAQATPDVKAEMAKQAAADVAAGDGGKVKGVRIGEHGSKTRLVFDLDTKSKPAFTYDLDNNEKLLIVNLPSSAWAGAESGKPNSPMIEGWTVQKAGSGSTVAIQLKKGARVLSTEYLKGEGRDAPRLVVDIAANG